MSGADDSGAGRRTTWTLDAIKQGNLALEGYCVTKDCGRFYAFNVDGFIASAGADYLVPEIIPGMECTACGGALEFKLAMMPPADEDAAETGHVSGDGGRRA